jgi:hypothetical protein
MLSDKQNDLPEDPHLIDVKTEMNAANLVIDLQGLRVFTGRLYEHPCIHYSNKSLKEILPELFIMTSRDHLS